MNLCVAAGIMNGPVFRVFNGDGSLRRAKIWDLDQLFHDALRKLQDLRPDLISHEVDVAVEFNIQRSLCSGTGGCVLDLGVEVDVFYVLYSYS
jgi:hypothetical protein